MPEKSLMGNERKTILIVDDMDDIRELVSLILRKAGYDVLEAANGRDALEKLYRTKVEMVITDLKMPEMDGIELIKELRGIDSFREMPIIVLSGEFGSFEGPDRLAEADEWITKPFIPKHLLNIVRGFHQRNPLPLGTGH